MSYGSIAYIAHRLCLFALPRSPATATTPARRTHRDFYKYGANTIVQVASGRFGIEERCSEPAPLSRSKPAGQKPGIGGICPARRSSGRVQDPHDPEGADAISPRRITTFIPSRTCATVYCSKEATQHKKPVIVALRQVHNIAAIASGIRSGADIIAIDGYRGGGAACPRAHP